MCLVSQRKEPFIAQRDIKVYKLLRYNETKGVYVTPFYDKEVQIGENLYGGETLPELAIDDDNLINIGKGYVHAYVKPLQKHYISVLKWLSIHGKAEQLFFYEAIIPKGTEYYIDRFFDTICAKKMIIQDKYYLLCELELVEVDNSYLFEPILDFIDKNKVSPGWLMNSDKTFIHPSEYKDEMNDDIIGIVGTVENNEAIVIARNKDGYRVLTTAITKCQ